MICPKCQSENPELNRFCGMCGNRLNDSGSAVETTVSNVMQAAPSSDDETRDGRINDVNRRPFIVSTTAIADTNTQVTRVAVPQTLGSATHSSYVPVAPLNLRSEVEAISHGEYIPVAEPAPVDPQDEPLFSDATPETANDSIHVMKTAEEREREEWARKAQEEREAYRPTLASNAPVSGSILGLTAPVSEAVSEAPPYVEERERTYPIGDEEDVAAQPGPESFLRFDEPEEYTGRDVSGPSFLGLGANDDPEYLLEEGGTQSHARRYLLLLIFAVVAVLGVMEWRASSKGESTNPMDVLHLKIPKKKGQGEVVVAPNSPSSSAATTASNASTGSNNGKPDLIAEPNQPAVQPSTATQPPAETASSASPSGPPATGLNDGVPANASGKTPAASTTSSAKPADAKVAKEEPTVPPSAKADTTPPDNPPVRAAASPANPGRSKPAAPIPAKTAATAANSETTASVSKKPGPGRPPASSDATTPVTGADPSLSAGSFELRKGVAAGATAEGRTWLWRAMSKGNGEAPVLLADMYAQGKGVTKDCEQAVLLLKAASKKANPHARSKLGSMYATGQCVPRDRVEAYRWMHSALQVNPGSEWLEKNQETLWNEMSAGERQRASAYR